MTADVQLRLPRAFHQLSQITNFCWRNLSKARVTVQPAGRVCLLISMVRHLHARGDILALCTSSISDLTQYELSS
jgi:hypothetical protein